MKNQREMPFLSKLDAPQYAPANVIDGFENYRDAVLWCWENRPYHGLSDPVDQALCARCIGLHAPHMSRCVNKRTKAPMSLNPDLLPAFEGYTGWKAASQYIARKANMTPMEQVIAERRAA